MRVLRWVLLLLYVLTILTLTGMGLAEGGDMVWVTLIGVGVLVISQVVLLSGAGFSDLCRPVRPRRLIIPVVIAAFMMAVLIVAVVLALSELFRTELPFPQVLFWVILGASWAFWFIVLFLYTRRVERYRVIKRLFGAVFAGSLLELLAAVPSHLIVMRRPGCFVGMGTRTGITAGVYVMLWAFGPGIFLLFVRAKHQADSAHLPDTQGSADTGGK